MSLENARKPNPAGNYLFKANNRITKTRCEICSKLTIKILERRHWRRSGVFIVNFKHILHLVVPLFGFKYVNERFASNVAVKILENTNKQNMVSGKIWLD